VKYTYIKIFVKEILDKSNTSETDY